MWQQQLPQQHASYHLQSSLQLPQGIARCLRAHDAPIQDFLHFLITKIRCATQILGTQGVNAFFSQQTSSSTSYMEETNVNVKSTVISTHLVMVMPSFLSSPCLAKLRTCHFATMWHSQFESENMKYVLDTYF